MTIANPLSITYGDLQVGGSSSYQVHGPYALDKSHDSLRLVFDVIVTAGTYAQLKSLSDTLESTFRARLVDGDTLKIDLDGAAWTYTVGTTLLRAGASIAKTGNRDVDHGFARGYTVTVEADLPADSTIEDGLRDVEVLVTLSAARQRTVTMRGVYTATSSGTALANYSANFDSRASDFLSLIASSATWELVDESYTLDRETSSGSPSPHLLPFSRTYVELLADQSQAGLDDTDIRDHRITFTDTAQYPGDSAEQLERLHRVIAVYDCAVDADETSDLQGTFDDKIRPHVVALFESNFQPQTFGVEQQSVSLDTTRQRVFVSMVFVFKPQSSEAIVELSQSLTVRELRTIDYTPTHSENEFAAFADVGWATKERIWNRTVIVIGEAPPQSRLPSRDGSARRANLDTSFSESVGGIAGPDARNAGGPLAGTGGPIQDGWNQISSTSQSTPQWLGMPGGEQVQLTTLTESVVERYHESP